MSLLLLCVRRARSPPIRTPCGGKDPVGGVMSSVRACPGWPELPGNSLLLRSDESTRLTAVLRCWRATPTGPLGPATACRCVVSTWTAPGATRARRLPADGASAACRRGAHDSPHMATQAFTHFVGQEPGGS